VKRSERMELTLLGYGIGSDVAKQLVAEGYGVTRLRKTPTKELAARFGEVVADKVKARLRRKPVPSETLLRLIDECDWGCCICWRRGGHGPVIVHHITKYSDTQDNSYDNLVVLCPIHHDEAHTTSELSGPRLPPEMLRQHKQDFAKAISGWKAGTRPEPGSETPSSQDFSDQQLQELCSTSLHQYGQEEQFLTVREAWIQRETRVPTETSDHSIELLVAQAGMGKSVSAYHALEQHLASGGYGFWLPVRFVEGAVSLISALDTYLQGLAPGLRQAIVEQHIQAVPSRAPLLLVVDDVSRASNPTQVLARLLQWTKPSKRGRTQSIGSEPRYVVVCPVWPRFWQAVKRRFGGETNWVRVTKLGPLTTAEAAEAIRRATSSSITGVEASELAYRLGGDPFLIGLASLRVWEAAGAPPGCVADEILQGFINDKLSDASESDDAPPRLIASDYRNALMRLVSEMLQRRRLRPMWQEVRSWFASDADVLGALDWLCRDRQLCRIDSGTDVFTFRHDRILSALMAETIAGMLDKHAEYGDILLEPFFAEEIGQALARSVVVPELLALMAEHLPLALAEALQSIGEPTTAHHRAVVGELIRWGMKYQRGGPESVRNAMLASLLRTDSSAVMDITDIYLDDNLGDWRLLARFRNGCSASGVEYCKRHGLAPVFSPSPYGRIWYDIVEHAVHHHRQAILPGLQETLTSPNTSDADRKGAVVLAGFLGSPELVEHIVAAWSRDSDKASLLTRVVPAATRCLSEKNAGLADALMAYWAELPDVPESDRGRVRDSVSGSCWSLFGFGITDAAAEYLRAKAWQHATLRANVACMLSTCDEPDGIEFAVRVFAHQDRGTLASDSEHDRSDTEHFLYFWHRAAGEGQRLSAETMDRLKGLWRTSKEDQGIRAVAFRLWLTQATREHLGVITEIGRESPLFHDAARARMRLRDSNVVPQILDLLSGDTVWLQLAHLVWDIRSREHMIPVVDDYLAALAHSTPNDYSGGVSDDHYNLMNLLLRIPPEDAETLLSRNWGHLRYSRLFIWASMLVGTPRCKDMASQSLSECPDGVDIFDGFFARFTFFGPSIRMEQLDNLRPFAARMTDEQVAGLATVCQHLGPEGVEWSRKNLSDLLEERGLREQYHPTMQDLVLRLDALAERPNPYYWAGQWLEDVKVATGVDLPLEALERWMASDTTHERYEFVAACIDVAGSRSDLDILDKYPVQYAHLFATEWTRESTKFSVRRRTLD
jgi:hypothetical protein